MNYRHSYHAGNACEVVKHAAYAVALAHYGRKPTPFFVLDTHAGIGLYDLDAPAARQTKEADAGVRRVLAWKELSPALANYARIVRSFNAGADGPLYPGSPFWARSFFRDKDRLAACERHPEDVLLLKRRFHGDAQVQVHHRDGYEAIGALLPPKERRGLVFMDPPFERPDEFDRLVHAVATIHRRWSQACVMIWYPIKDRPAVWRFHEALTACAYEKVLAAEFLFHQEIRSDRLNGSGLILANPPWQMEVELEATLAALQPLSERFDDSSAPCFNVKWLRHTA